MEQKYCLSAVLGDKCDPSANLLNQFNSHLVPRPGSFNGNREEAVSTSVIIMTYHDAGADGDAASAVRVGHDVAVADRQERDRQQPHRVEQVLVLHVVVAATRSTHTPVRVSGHYVQTW